MQTPSEECCLREKVLVAGLCRHGEFLRDGTVINYLTRRCEVGEDREEKLVEFGVGRREAGVYSLQIPDRAFLLECSSSRPSRLRVRQFYRLHIRQNDFELGLLAAFGLYVRDVFALEQRVPEGFSEHLKAFAAKLGAGGKVAQRKDARGVEGKLAKDAGA
jgi:hypothetical protein